MSKRSPIVFGIESLERIDSGSYETRDQEYSIRRVGRRGWRLAHGAAHVATCDTKLSCQVVLARHRALRSGVLDAAEYRRETERWRSTR